MFANFPRRRRLKEPHYCNGIHETRQGNGSMDANLAHLANLVLVIDSEKLVRDGLEELLDMAGLTVLGAANGSDGVQLFEEHHSEIQAVILDARLPGMTSEEVLDRLLDIYAEVKIIVTSGFSPTEVTRRFAGRRVAAFVAKPYNIDALLAQLQGP